MPEPAPDHRRATAERNAAAILDATDRLLARHAPLSMAAVAAEAGVSRPTLYAHHPTLPDLIEAAVGRAVQASLAAVEAAEPDSGPPAAALERMIAASWGHLGGLDALARAAAEHLPAAAVRRTHAPLAAHVRRLVERGRRDGSFRSDLPADWLVTTYFALVHAADEHARGRRVARADTLAAVTVTLGDLFRGPPAE
jgi:AcrR family transcriptional regulator